jgi:2'-5' RNA ligase
MKRLFVAVKIAPGENFLKTYYSLKKDLKNEKIKWVEPQNMHITLKFLGETHHDKIPLIENVLKRVAINNSSFGFSVENTGVFGSRYNPRVLWFGINNNKQLKNLGEEIIDALDAAGFKRDRQNFVPHLTVGRIKFLESKKYFQRVVDGYKNVFFQNVEVNKFYLYESILKSTGPVYHPLKEFSLNA